MNDYIRLAFEGDEDIYKFFDPTASVDNLDDVVDNISNKIEECIDVLGNCVFHGFDSGYVFYCKQPSLLISFGINVSERKSNRLWDEIVGQVGDSFDCMLWSKNERAIRWLQKMGMEVDSFYSHEDNSITKLKFSICH